MPGESILGRRYLIPVGTYITKGEYDFETATIDLVRNDADLVSPGRLFIANPDLVERFKRGSPLNMTDPGTFYGGDDKGHTDYPFLDCSDEEG